MENMDFDSNNTSDEDLNFQAKPINSSGGLSNSSSALINLVPQCVLQTCNLTQSNEALIHQAITKLHLASKVEDLGEFFKQLGADLKTWMNKLTVAQKVTYLLNCLTDNVQENLKKVNSDAQNLIKTLTSKQKAKSQKNLNNYTHNFDWFNIKTSNQMLMPKLKTKLVQTINQFKNEKKLRDAMGRKLQEEEKVHLEDDSFQMTEDQNNKINYEWTQEDQRLFLTNITKLKEKFTKTQFLKNCHRYKFITNTELATLASQDISRKLDRNSKAFLSRDFLLDKYFSTKENLTEKQIKFILKTSPMLSKCVDKNFVRSAIKNIQYEDIDKMELQIAEQIITKFQTVRNMVRGSRKSYKQGKNNETKKKIMQFQEREKYNMDRNLQIQNFQKHKTKMLRSFNYQQNTQSSKENKILYKKQKKQAFNNKKITWPVPLNNSHPPTAIFIKDCTEQCSEDLNEYEKQYYQKLFNSEQKSETSFKNSAETKQAMIRFYTGGPLQNYKSAFRDSNTSIKHEKNVNSPYSFQEALKIVCETFKKDYYFKEMGQKIDSYEDNRIIEGLLQLAMSPKTTNTIKTNDIGTPFNELSSRTRKQTEKVLQQNKTVFAESIGANLNGMSEEAIKNKIIQGKQKARMAVYIKKLLCLAAENSFISLKALNVKFSPAQINTQDKKGNTALFYAAKNKNKDFVDYLIGNKADPNIKGEKGQTPLHNAFKSSDFSLICKCFVGFIPPNLNILDDFGKTPLAYCSTKVLEKLGLQQGVCSVPIASISRPPNFDNNIMLSMDRMAGKKEDELEFKVEIKARISTLPNKQSSHKALPSLILN